ncbi:TIR domain-containing protein [Rufibacter glacialis]|uniref:TIR domain-containing protein n=1 Tax=Rufibacter glacialis TaxID=1259555 RepID=A0A5M8QBU6_9BACT|nr:nucleotide-binding protein [Rufibacter glacialis]KAA6433485.1 hypothetical protein FOE74_13545 [Rufibacter glacialis]GGK73810.1 hypothetical protein GCM10011405_22310 [Rufibacter glacialis]
MALNPDLIAFYIKRIRSAEERTFGSEAAHLFQHIHSEVKDNPIFQKYEIETSAWKGWPNDVEEDAWVSDWYLPSEHEKAKSLSYYLYKKSAEMKENASQIVFALMQDRTMSSSISKFNTVFLDYFSQALDDIIRANPELVKDEPAIANGNTVFIIHGHDGLMKTQVQLLLTRAGVRNIVLHEQPDRGRTIIDKLVEEGRSSNYAIALFSPDDSMDGGHKRARQNVVLEVGYFMGKLGKERVRMLVNDNLEIPSDLSGILYEKYDASGAWKMKILKELQAVGIFVDFNSVLNLF